jgi:valyl-tRNA synthetase
METRRSGQKVLHNSLLNILKLYAPFLPYITEDLFQNCFAKDEKLKSIHISKWPEGNKTLINEEAEKIGDALVEVISAVRKAKSEKGVSLKEPVKELTIALTEKEVMPFLDDLRAVTKAEKISFEQELCVTL